MRSLLCVLVLVLARLLTIDAQSWTEPLAIPYGLDITFAFTTDPYLADYTVWYMTYTSGYWAVLGYVPVNTVYAIQMPCLQITTAQSIEVSPQTGVAFLFNGDVITQTQLHSANVTGGPHIPGYVLIPDGVYTVQFAFFNNETGSLQKVNGTVAGVSSFVNPAVPVYIFSPLNNSIWGTTLNLTYVPPSPGSSGSNALTLTFSNQGSVVSELTLNPGFFAEPQIYSSTFSVAPIPYSSTDLFQDVLSGTDSIPPGVYNISMLFSGYYDPGDVTTTVYNVQLGATVPSPIIYSPADNTAWAGILNFTYSLPDAPAMLASSVSLTFLNGSTAVDQMNLDPSCWSGAMSNGTGFYGPYRSFELPVGPHSSCVIMMNTSLLDTSSCSSLLLSVTSFSIPPGTYNISMTYTSPSHLIGSVLVTNVTIGDPDGIEVDLSPSSCDCTNTTVYVNQTVNRTVYVNQTVYEPCDCTNTTVYVNQTVNRTVYVNQTVYEPCDCSNSDVYPNPIASESGNCTNQTVYVNRTEPESCSCPDVDFFFTFHDIPLYGWWCLLGGGGLLVGNLVTLLIVWVCMRRNYMSLST